MCEYQMALDGGWYRYFNEIKTFDEARKICESDGAKLMTIRSEKTLTFIKEAPLEGSAMYKWFWIGLTDRDSEGDFKWIYPVEGSCEISVENWGSNEPNGGLNEQCTVA